MCLCIFVKKQVGNKINLNHTIIIILISKNKKAHPALLDATCCVGIYDIYKPERFGEVSLKTLVHIEPSLYTRCVYYNHTFL